MRILALQKAISALIVILAIMLLTNCTGLKSFGVEKKAYRGYQPIEPIPQKAVEFYQEDCKCFSLQPWASLSDSTIRSLLPNQSSQVSMKQIDRSGKINFMTSSVSHESGSYEVIMDYMKYRTDDAIVKDTLYGSARIGIGLRVKASVITKKSDLNLSGLSNLGVQASLGNLSGYLSVDIIGIDSKDVTNHLPLTAKLDETSIQNALQAFAAIKSKIWDSDIRLTPQVIAIYQVVDSSEVIIKNEVANVSKFAFTSSSQILLDYWKPDGKTRNMENEEKILALMSEYGLESALSKLVPFIYSKEMEPYRVRVINDLNLK